MKWCAGLLLLVAVMASWQFSCKPASETSTEKNHWLNLHDSVQYVGMQTCRSCHADIYDTYIQTGMGRSFGIATRERSNAIFEPHTIVYDSATNFYYHPFFRNDSLFITEFRLNKKDTIHSRTEHVSYIIGSGNHTNSHLVNFNGYVYQAPITFYTQKQQWDLAPGFDKGFNSRFQRIIAHECMTCHNGLPDYVQGSENKYLTVPEGIDCERCHGAGGLHVKEKLAGIIVDTAQHPDYTIVNPRRLSKSLQMSLCQRCHLQGVSVLNEEKSFDDFRPGMNLGDVFHVFLPEFESKQNNFLMASHVERLKLSKCYLNSEMTCITCHNPHVSVKQTPKEVFNEKCVNCHGGNSKFKIQNSNSKVVFCSLSEAERSLKQNDCSGCHMPRSPSIDIPHVSINDHFIRKKNLITGNQISLEEIEKIQTFVQLKCYTTDTPDALLKAKGFLAFYEKFSSRKQYLDSVQFYLSQADEKLSFNTIVHFYFLQNNFSAIISLFEKGNTTNHAWTLYRIGESYYYNGNFTEALKMFEKAIEKSPGQLDFLNKAGAVKVQLRDIAGAKRYFQQVISLQPHHKEAKSNLGYLYFLEGDYARAEKLFDSALADDPDYVQALSNKLMLQRSRR